MSSKDVSVFWFNFDAKNEMDWIEIFEETNFEIIDG